VPVQPRTHTLTRGEDTNKTGSWWPRRGQITTLFWLRPLTLCGDVYAQDGRHAKTRQAEAENETLPVLRKADVARAIRAAGTGQS